MTWVPECALVTGATSGIGEAAALALVEAGVGTVIVVGRDARRAEGVCARIEELRSSGEIVLADLSEAAAADAIFAEIDRRGLLVDSLVNAAGLTTRTEILDIDLADYEALFAVNVRSPVLLFGRFAKRLRRAGAPGTVVDVLSNAMHGGAPDISVYSMTKAALGIHTRNAAYALQNDGIRVNGLAMGWTLTPGEDTVMRSTHGAGDGWETDYAGRRPLGRLMRSAEVARAIRFLATGESSPMTGSIVTFDQVATGITDLHPH
ncbi:MAG: SDR family oxidoreductase [Acidimicrobiia bacterium]|nr:SDR family oxidoreductase [Acidimicrobiia bacterium]MYJ14495.1 SDR family oxidoreductase [Acidimicrobiia bacterium]